MMINTTSPLPENQEKNALFTKKYFTLLLQEVKRLSSEFPRLKPKAGCAYGSNKSKKDLTYYLSQNARSILSPIESLLLLSLLHHQDEQTGRLDVTNETLAREMKRSVRTVGRALKNLKDAYPDCIRVRMFTIIPFQTRRNIFVDWDRIDYLLSVSKKSNDSIHGHGWPTKLQSLSTKVHEENCLKNSSIENMGTGSSHIEEGFAFSIEEEKISGEEKFIQEEKESGKESVIHGKEERIMKGRVKEEFERRNAALKEKMADAGKGYDLSRRFEGGEDVDPDIGDGGVDWGHLREVAKLRQTNAERLSPRARVTVPVKEEKIMTKRSARAERISQIPSRYPNYKTILKRENLTLKELQWKMRENENYEPFHDDSGRFDHLCHPRYGFMGEQERDVRFVQAVDHWFGCKPYRHSQRNLKMFHKARKRADSIKALYYDYVAAQFDWWGEYEALYTHVNNRWGIEIYTMWVDRGKPYPKGLGSFRLQEYYRTRNKEFLKARTAKQVRKTLEESLEEARRVIPVFAKEYRERRGL